MSSRVKNSAHPLYSAMLKAWKRNRDCYEGEEKIKSERDEYLPATSGMIADGFGTADVNSIGNKAYDAYVCRAYFADVVKEAVETAIGVMHREEAVFELTPRLEVLLERATYDGETLQMLLRSINEQQLVTGRLGLLGDFRADPNVQGAMIPVLSTYLAEAVFNWDDILDEEAEADLRFVALDESTYELADNFSWKFVDRVRLLALADREGVMVPQDTDANNEERVQGIYSKAEVRDDVSLQQAVTQLEPLNLQGQEFNRIPFSFINSKDLAPAPDQPPLDGVASIALAIYRAEADYRQNLFLQGQDTLVVVGSNEDSDKPVRTGAGARIDLPLNGDAKYIGVESQGLSEQRQSLANDYARAESKTSKLVNAGGQESGEALRIRMAAQTATLPQIAQTGAAGLQKVLRDLAQWMGENPEDVTVTPNLEFADTIGDAQSLLSIVQAKIQGAPISNESIHAWMQENKFTNLDYEAELALLDGEGIIGGNSNTDIPPRRGAAEAETGAATDETDQGTA